jgi:hypothetical protein
MQTGWPMGNLDRIERQQSACVRGQHECLAHVPRFFLGEFLGESSDFLTKKAAAHSFPKQV